MVYILNCKVCGFYFICILFILFAYCCFFYCDVCCFNYFFSIFAIEYSVKLLFHLIIIIMEKIFMRFSLMFMCLVLFFLSSCNKEDGGIGGLQNGSNEIEKYEPASEEFISLYSAVEQYNNDFYQKCGINYADLQTKGFWKNFWKGLKNVLSVVAADVTGAVNGANLGKGVGLNQGGIVSVAVVSGVVSSLNTAIKVLQTSNTTPASSEENAKLINKNFTGSEVGELHNIVIDRILTRYDNDGIFVMDIDSFYVAAEKELRSIYAPANEVNLGISKVGELKYKVKKLSDELSVCNNEEALSYVRTFDMQYVDELNLIADYICNLQFFGDSLRVVEYSEGYYNVVKNSSIPDYSKQLILVGTSTAVNSYLLWKEEN